MRNNPRDMVNPGLNPRAKSAIIGIAHQKSRVCLLRSCVSAGAHGHGMMGVLSVLSGMKDSVMASADTQTGNVPVKTAAELGLTGIDFPSDFTARFMAMDASGCWYAFDARPTYEYEEWKLSGGKWFEIGCDEKDGATRTPAFARGMSASDALFEVALTQ